MKLTLLACQHSATASQPGTRRKKPSKKSRQPPQRCSESWRPIKPHCLRWTPTLARVQALHPLINVSAIAKAAQISVQTLSSKITRGTALTEDESSRIGRVLMAHGVPA